MFFIKLIFKIKYEKSFDAYLHDHKNCKTFQEIDRQEMKRTYSRYNPAFVNYEYNEKMYKNQEMILNISNI